MWKYVVKRLALVPVIVFVVATVVFFALRVVPGNAANSLSIQDPSQKAQITKSLGLDHSMLYQYGKYLVGLIHFNFGDSYYSGRPVAHLLEQTMPATIELAIASMIVMLSVGLGTGAVAARLSGTWLDTAARFASTGFFSMPWFWLGVIFITIFTVEVHLLPSYGRLPAGMQDPGPTHFILIDAIVHSQYGLIWPWIEHLILPALTVGLTTAGFISRVTRSALGDALAQDHIRTARAKGLSEAQIFRRHAVRNASLPVATVIGLQFGSLLGGAVIAEVVFAYPGVGQELVNAVFQRDYPVVEGAALLIAVLCVLVNLATDLAYLVLDPRLRRT